MRSKKTKYWILITVLLSLLTAYDQIPNLRETSALLQPTLIEERVGLSILYKLRPEKEKPKNVLIVTPNRSAVDKFNKSITNEDDFLSANLTKFNRKIHADVVNKLNALDAPLIAIDIQFTSARANKDEDDALEKAIANSKNVVLAQGTQLVDVLENSKILNKRREIQKKGWILINPLKSFSDKALSLAHPKYPSDKEKVNSFRSYLRTVAPDHIKPEDFQCNGYFSTHNFKGEIFDLEKSHHQRLSPSLPVELLYIFLLQHSTEFNLGGQKELNQCVHRNGEFLGSLKMPPPPNMIILNNAFESWNKVIKAPNELFYVNYYGPPWTIETIDYHDFLNNEYKPSALKDSIVFIGVSDTSGNDQRDPIRTIFSENGYHISGVEYQATVFANLIEKSFLVRLTPINSLLLTILISAILFYLSSLRSLSVYLLLVISLVIVLITFALYLFNELSFWIPITIPGILVPLSLLVLEIVARYFTEKNLKEQIRQKLSLYLPRSAIKDLNTSEELESEYQLTQGACLVTDVQGFSGIAEELGPIPTANLVGEYFKIVSECVMRNSGEIFLIDGDSVTGIWSIDSSLPDLCQKACQAAVEIQEELIEFNAIHASHPFKTRMGLAAGEFAVGNIGSFGHQSYAVMGETIYTASRLEQLNKETGTFILATEYIANNVTDFKSKFRGNFLIRGMSKRLNVYTISRY